MKLFVFIFHNDILIPKMSSNYKQVRNNNTQCHLYGDFVLIISVPF